MLPPSRHVKKTPAHHEIGLGGPNRLVRGLGINVASLAKKTAHPDPMAEGGRPAARPKYRMPDRRMPDRRMPDRRMPDRRPTDRRPLVPSRNAVDLSAPGASSEIADREVYGATQANTFQLFALTPVYRHPGRKAASMHRESPDSAKLIGAALLLFTGWNRLQRAEQVVST